MKLCSNHRPLKGNIHLQRATGKYLVLTANEIYGMSVSKKKKIQTVNDAREEWLVILRTPLKSTAALMASYWMLEQHCTWKIPNRKTNFAFRKAMFTSL